MRGIIFEVTSKCNLACRYCYNIHKAPLGISAATGGYRKAKRTLKHLFRTVDVERVTMTGGEPLLQERFLELALYCRMKGKRVVIISNGTTGDEYQYKSLVDIGVRLFELPVHSTVPSEHDKMTGFRSSHETVLENIGILKRLGAFVVPVIVVTQINRGRVAETLKYLSDMGLRRIMLNRFNIGGAGIEASRELALTVPELRETFRKASDTAQALGLNVTSNVCSPVCVLDNRDFPGIRFGRCNPKIERRPITMDLNGDIRFCNHSPVVMGNIFRDDIQSIITNDYAQSWKHRPSFCGTCDKWTRCYGGCRAASEQVGGTVQDVDPILATYDRPPFLSPSISS